MANPYLTNFTRAVPDLREAPGYHAVAGNVAGPARTTQSPGQPQDWLSKYGLTMCDFFKRLGKGIGTDPTFTGEVESAKAKFDTAYEAYEKPIGSEIKDFAWDCFVQGFDEGRPAESKSSAPSADDSWGFVTWALVLGGLGAAGLFGYNYVYAK